MSLKRIGITIGDPAGIGPEIIVKALTDHPEIYELCTPVVFAPRAILKRQIAFLVKPAQLVTVTDLANLQEPLEPGQIALFETPLVTPLPSPGETSAAGGEIAFKSIKAAIEQASEKQIDAVVTAPINKQSLKATQIPFLDHTAMFTELTGSQDTMTLFVTGSLRIFFYSRHIPFREIVDHLTEEKLIETIRSCMLHLDKLGFARAHLAVAALNPHAGEGGLFGDEEIRIIKPAILKAREEGFRIAGPISADSVFHLAHKGRFDAVLSLYHDQGHIAAKTLDFFRTVSVTLGLPFLRTSVDHGTAFEIAGQNVADETSMVEAIKTAARFAW